jgi:hypothetical protein
MLIVPCPDTSDDRILTDRDRFVRIHATTAGPHRSHGRLSNLAHLAEIESAIA